LLAVTKVSYSVMLSVIILRRTVNSLQYQRDVASLLTVVTLSLYAVRWGRCCLRIHDAPRGLTPPTRVRTVWMSARFALEPRRVVTQSGYCKLKQKIEALKMQSGSQQERKRNCWIVHTTAGHSKHGNGPADCAGPCNSVTGAFTHCFHGYCTAKLACGLQVHVLVGVVISSNGLRT
jgi:hypothetical protein